MLNHKSQGKKALPEGWRWVRLGDICEITMGQSPPGSTYRKTPDGMPFFQGKTDFGKTNPVVRIWCIAPQKIAQPGDILISVRAPVGPTNVADIECCIGRGLAAIRCGFNTNLTFILYALRHFESSIAERGTGSTFEAINRNDLVTFKIPLPPLTEQQRIATVLSEQMAAVDKARAASEARLEAVKALPAAFLRQVFPQPDQALPDGWRWVRLGDICEITMGQSPPGSTYRKTPDGMPFFQGKTDFGKTNPVVRIWCIAPQKIAQPGDILISVRAPVGPTNVADIECCIGRGLAAIRCGFNTNLTFILYALRHFESSIAERGTGSTFEAINRNDLVTFKIPLPPLPQQHNIATTLAEKMATVEKMRTAVEAELEAINALPAALLRRAFSGGL